MWLMLSFAFWTIGQAVAYEERVDGARAVEQARAAWAATEPAPSDPGADREVAAKQVTLEMREESLLSERFGMHALPEMLSAEFERIERHTQDPGGWDSVKRALGNDRRKIEETVCRPLVVDRLLRLRVAFDDSIQAEAHGKARQARSRFLAGQSVDGLRVVRLARTPAAVPDVRAWLAEAKAQANGQRVLSTPERDPEPIPDGPIPLHPEAARVLETQLQRPGDVSTILSEQDRFVVFRLIEATDESWKVEAAVFPKRDFAEWYRSVALARAGQSGLE